MRLLSSHGGADHLERAEAQGGPVEPDHDEAVDVLVTTLRDFATIP